jgi:hypothetical protein
VIVNDCILEAVQKVIDRDRTGWRVSHYVCVIGLDLINSDGQIETSAALYHPDGQADYVTDGLLGKADELFCTRIEEDTE